MAHIHLRKPWHARGLQPTPESVYLGRREFLAGTVAGLGGLAIGGCQPDATAQTSPSADRADQGRALTSETADLYPARRNPKYTLDRPITDQTAVERYNNFYEFTEQKDRVWKLVDKFQTRPWTVEVAGLVAKPRTYDIDDLIRKLPLEERLYRHRCVETWAMAVPWTGFPLKALIDAVEPDSSTKFVRFVSFKRPDEAPNQKGESWYPWPYFEALRMDEAVNELTLIATGLYGRELPKQNGAPIRLVTPWKYGFKSIKSILRIEFTADQPPTFWNQLVPNEYDFLANVNPEVPHPRWSQASEWMIDGTQLDRRPTQLYNGYGDYVASLYSA